MHQNRLHCASALGLGLLFIVATPLIGHAADESAKVLTGDDYLTPIWGEPVDLGSEVNNMGGVIEAKLGPDGHTLYFASNFVVPRAYPKSAASAEEGLRNMQSWNNGLSNIWKIDLTPWLKTDRR